MPGFIGEYQPLKYSSPLGGRVERNPLNKYIAQDMIDPCIDLIYKKDRTRKFYFLYGTVAVLLLSILFSLCIGSTPIGWQEVYNIIIGKADNATIQIVLNMRMPRVIAALLCGWALALSGSIMQIILKNPLASPYTLGISNAAAFGASLAIVFGGFAVQVPKSGDLTTIVNPYAIAMSAFACSLIALFIILIITKSLSHDSHTIILAGIIISSIFGAALSAIRSEERRVGKEC